MSHVVSVDVQLTDLDAIAKAADACGLIFSKSSTYKWFGRHMGDYPLPAGFTASDLGKCDYKLSMKGVGYEVGLVRRDGKYTMLFDFWGSTGRKLKQHLGGEDAAKFVAEYGFAAAQNAAQSLGWMTERTAEGLKVYHPGGGYLTVNDASQVEAFGFMGNGCTNATNELAAAMGSVNSQFAKPEANMIQQQNFQAGE